MLGSLSQKRSIKRLELCSCLGNLSVTFSQKAFVVPLKIRDACGSVPRILSAARISFLSDSQKANLFVTVCFLPRIWGILHTQLLPLAAYHGECVRGIGKIVPFTYIQWCFGSKTELLTLSSTKLVYDGLASEILRKA